MKIDTLSHEAQEGIRRWAKDVYGDDLMFDAIASMPAHWAWLTFLLRYSEDRPEWFPKGKFATIQIIEQKLADEAHSGVDHGHLSLHPS
jgi:hypothetical protein